MWKKGKKFGKYHGTCGHTTDKCTTLKTLIKQANLKRTKQNKQKKKYTKKEVSILLENKVRKEAKRKENEWFWFRTGSEHPIGKQSKERSQKKRKWVILIQNRNPLVPAVMKKKSWKIGQGKQLSVHVKHGSKEFKQNTDFF